MVKVQQCTQFERQRQISGCFRGEGVRYFCRIRGYILRCTQDSVSTLRKQGLNVLAGLESVFRGNPLRPQVGAE